MADTCGKGSGHHHNTLHKANQGHDPQSQHLLSTTTMATANSILDNHSIALPFNESAEQLSTPPSSHPSPSAPAMPARLHCPEVVPPNLRKPTTKRSYQTLPHLSIPLDVKSPVLAVRRPTDVEDSNKKISVLTLEPKPVTQTASSPETPTSTSSPVTPVSLSSPTVGVVDLTRNVKTTSSSPVSHGGYSDIYQGELEIMNSDGDLVEKRQVAIKVLRVLSAKGYDDAKARKRLNREVYVWHRLDHPNIATFLGTSYHMADRPSLVLPWFSNGSASEYLRRNPGANRLRLILDVAEGLKYLHTCKPKPIVHGDMKGNNILITDDGRATLSDFGLSQVIEDLVGPTGITPSCTEAGPIRWQSPEFLMDTSEIFRPQLPGDVWSFGCTAYELLTGKVPYHFRHRDATVIHDIQARIPPPGVEENDRHRGDGGIWDLMNDCWTISPTERIQMTDVVSRLKALCSSSIDSSF